MEDRYQSIEEMDRRCQALFALDDHEYIGGQWRIKSVPLRKRLSQLHPAWSTSVPQAGQLSAGGIQGLGGIQAVTMAGSMTLLGAMRSAIVAVPVQRDVKQPVMADAMVDAFIIAQDNLLMALAQMWNIGAYLRDIPKNITTLDQLDIWLGR